MNVSIFARFLAVFDALLLTATISSGSPGDLYVGGEEENSPDHFVFRFTPDGTRSTFASGLNHAGPMAFDRQGNLFVVDSGDGMQTDSFILKFAPDGSRSTFVDLGLGAPLDIAFDGSGNLYASVVGAILKYAPDGTVSTFASNLEGIWPLAFDRLGNLYAGSNPIGAGSILKFAPDGTKTTFATLSSGALSTAMAFDHQGNLFVDRGTLIAKITPDGSVTTFVTEDVTFPLAFDAEGNLFACLPFTLDPTAPTIIKFAPDGTQQTFAFPPPLFPTTLAFEPVTEKLRNISARGLVGTGDDALIGGFIIGGNALANNAVVVRAIGPSLAQAGLTSPLADPVLELHDASGTILASNDNWQDTQEAQITASGIAPTDPKEAAIYATLPIGSYTAVVRGVNDGTGTALVEVYSITE